jgi:hypothetical protein
MHPSFGIEDVAQPEQVVLIGPAAVMEDEQAGGLASRRPLAVDEGHGLSQAGLARTASNQRPGPP